MTHQLQYLQLADQIVVMNNGSIEQKGTFNQLQALGLDFMKLLKTIDTEGKKIQTRQSEIIRQQSSIDDAKSDGDISNDASAEMHEARAKGGMSRGVFLAYFKASQKPIMITLMMLIFIITQIISGGSDYFIAFWVNVESSSWHETNNRTMEFLWHGPLSRDGMIYLYSAMMVAIVLFWQFQTVVYFNVCMWSSVNLHSAMFRSILRTTMYFYNTNPAGRILNRCVRKL